MMVADDLELPQLADADRDLDAWCEAWVWWRREHRLYGSGTSALPGRPCLGRAPVGALTRPLLRPVGVFAPASMAALHVAYTCQPDALDKRVFDLYYILRVRPVKVAAGLLGIGTRNFYRILEDFRRRVAIAGRAFEANTPELDPSLIVRLISD